MTKTVEDETEGARLARACRLAKKKFFAQIAAAAGAGPIRSAVPAREVSLSLSPSIFFSSLPFSHFCADSQEKEENGSAAESALSVHVL